MTCAAVQSDVIEKMFQQKITEKMWEQKFTAKSTGNILWSKSYKQTGMILGAVILFSCCKRKAKKVHKFPPLALLINSQSLEDTQVEYISHKIHVG